MAIQSPKKEGLSERQSLLWELINASRYPASKIAEKSGVPNGTISNCIRGRTEMKEHNYRAVVETIMHFAFETPRRYWQKQAL